MVVVVGNTLKKIHHTSSEAEASIFGGDSESCDVPMPVALVSFGLTQYYIKQDIGYLKQMWLAREGSP